MAGKNHSLPPLPSVAERKPTRANVEILTLRWDRNDLKGQDRTIEDMSVQGYVHYESFGITSQMLAMRFRRNV